MNRRFSREYFKADLIPSLLRCSLIIFSNNFHLDKKKRIEVMDGWIDEMVDGWMDG